MYVCMYHLRPTCPANANAELVNTYIFASQIPGGAAS
jgi:hypothetical protein